MRQELKITGARHAFVRVLGSNASGGLTPLSMFEPIMKKHMLQL